MRLYIGYIFDEKLRPWKHITVEGICTSYMDICTKKKYSKKVADLGLRSALDYDGPILLDSGAYSVMKSGAIPPKLDDYADFIRSLSRQTDDIVAVNLDVIGNPTASLRNYERLVGMLGPSVLDRIPLLPVAHFPDSENMFRKYMDLCDYIGLGGMVPAMRTNKGKAQCFLFMRNKVIESCEASVHGFGVGSVTLIPVLKEIGLTSCDWIGWRVCAVYGNIQMPTRQVHITENKADKWSKNISEKEIKTIIEASPFSLDELKSGGSDGFVARASFNCWIVQSVAEDRFKPNLRWLDFYRKI